MHISEVFAHLKYNIIPAMKDTQEVRYFRVCFKHEIYYMYLHYLNNFEKNEQKSTDLSNLNEYKEFVSSDLKDYRIKRDLVNLRECQLVLLLLRIFYYLWLHLHMRRNKDMGVSEIIISQKTHIELPNYLGVEHNILRRKEYRRSFEYIEELINRKV